MAQQILMQTKKKGFVTHIETGPAFRQPRDLEVKVSASFFKKGAVDCEILHFFLCMQFFQPEEGWEPGMHVWWGQHLNRQTAEEETFHVSVDMERQQPLEPICGNLTVYFFPATFPLLYIANSALTCACTPLLGRAEPPAHHSVPPHSLWEPGGAGSWVRSSVTVALKAYKWKRQTFKQGVIRVIYLV